MLFLLLCGVILAYEGLFFDETAQLLFCKVLLCYFMLAAYIRHHAV